MKTIEERAKEYIKEGGSIGFPLEDNYFFEEAFTAGAKSEHEQLTRWNSPECPPEQRKVVLLKYKIRIKEGKEYKERTICRTGYHIFDEYVCHDRCMDLHNY